MHRPPVCAPAVSELPSASNASIPRLAGSPAHSANASGRAGPKTCRYRRASSRRASRGSISGGGTVQTIGQPRTIPADQDRAGRRGVPEPVRIDTERLLPPRRRSSCSPPRCACRRAAMSSATRRGRPRPEASLARRPRDRAPRRRTHGAADPRAGRATGPPRSSVRSPRRAHGSRGGRRAACCPAGRPTPPAGGSGDRAGAVRRARRHAAGTRGSAAVSGGAEPLPARPRRLSRRRSARGGSWSTVPPGC